MSQRTLPSPEEEEQGSSRPAKDLTPAETFFRHFQQEVSNIEALISSLGDISADQSERGDAIDHCLASIARVNQEVKDASSYIPAYDQRTYGEAIKALGVKLQDARARVEPKKKFAFNKKAKARDPAQKSGITPSASSSAAMPAGLPSSTNGTESKANEASPAKESETEPAPSTTLLLDNEANKHIILPISPSNANGSGTLTTLTHCIVDMTNSPSTGEQHALQTLTLRNINTSLLLCSRVHGAVHTTSLRNSVLVVRSRQFRMHDSRNCDVYLHTASRPIIEDCAGIRFAPLPDAYRTGAEEGVEDQWQRVDDFKWLRAEASPNWSVLPAGERVGERVWREVVPGSPRVGLEEILRAVGVVK